MQEKIVRQNIHAQQIAQNKIHALAIQTISQEKKKGARDFVEKQIPAWEILTKTSRTLTISHLSPRHNFSNIPSLKGVDSS